MPCPRMAGSPLCNRRNRLCRAIGSLWCSFALQPTGGLVGAMTVCVEHLVSGQAARFHSLEELLAFMVRVLADVQAPAEAP